ncbi:MAG: hypothetical protein M3O50_15395 [Myxococcota bacterium]|nr:hypothetical protein [Myxococcota bacterium]
MALKKMAMVRVPRRGGEEPLGFPPVDGGGVESALWPSNASADRFAAGRSVLRAPSLAAGIP